MESSNQVDLSELPQGKGWGTPGIRLYQGCWLNIGVLPKVIALQQHFRAQEKDIFLASHPKCGTTWLKALLFSIANRHLHAPANSPLLTTNPQAIVKHLEVAAARSISDLNAMQQRLFATHIPYGLLPEVITGDSFPKCRVVYVCRNPLDTIASFWKFHSGGHPFCWPDWTLEECVDSFCQGQSAFGPYWDHVLGFWKASLEKPEKVLFLKYEDMLEDTRSEVRKIAEFVGFPFSAEEETGNVVDQIVELCSLKNLKQLDVNKNSVNFRNVDIKLFFRKGEIGDWVNHLSPSMVERVKKIVEEKLHGSGLTFKYVA